ncbi:MAG TPA: hypothetical protein VND68_03885, partial [Chloroflexia bacterium]|nr:hypothetical protein [Chloroflexia bacterium]
MQEDAGLLAPKGEPTPDIAFSPEAFSRLMEVCHTRMPAETVGALVGTSLVGRGRRRVEISGVEAVEFVPAVQGVLTLKQQWETLVSNIASAEVNLCIVGWFYADPGMGLFPPRLNILSVRQTLALDDRLLLLINPLANQWAFYAWAGSTYVHASGFTGGSGDVAAPVTAGWDPVPRGASRWLETAIAGTMADSTRHDTEPPPTIEDGSAAMQPGDMESGTSYDTPRRKRRRRAPSRSMALAGLGGLLGVTLVVALASSALAPQAKVSAIPAPSTTPGRLAARTVASLTTQSNPTPTAPSGGIAGQVVIEPTATGVTQPTATTQAAGQGATPGASPSPTGPGFNTVNHTVAS